jgi:hypothetical protein
MVVVVLHGGGHGEFNGERLRPWEGRVKGIIKRACTCFGARTAAMQRTLPLYLSCSGRPATPRTSYLFFVWVGPGPAKLLPNPACERAVEAAEKLLLKLLCKPLCKLLLKLL